ncbi:hypothetical protein EYR41_008404 [Orbilia oligospora]|uniref:Uncharacterized protein n=1 Tax=Orbilia oligospora TaxID=2813651 RepID=A0A8H2DXM2_ORBOL|nr:hypothetical protein EYR41_008404 [Orbilia oligospora]
MIQSNLGFQNQTPILLEDAENVFLGPEKETERPVGHIIDREYHENSGHLIITVDLDIGWAHGADVGAIYDVIPLGEPIQADLGIKAQITESLGNKGLQSRATIPYPLVWGTHISAAGYPRAFNTLERVTRIPTTSFEDENWVVNLVRLLNHLLRFQQLQSIRSLRLPDSALFFPSTINSPSAFDSTDPDFKSPALEPRDPTAYPSQNYDPTIFLRES